MTSTPSADRTHEAEVASSTPDDAPAPGEQTPAPESTTEPATEPDAGTVPEPQPEAAEAASPAEPAEDEPEPAGTTPPGGEPGDVGVEADPAATAESEPHDAAAAVAAAPAEPDAVVSSEAGPEAAPAREETSAPAAAAGEGGPAGEHLQEQPAEGEQPKEQAPAKQPKPKPAGPSPKDVVKRIGDTNERAFAYVLEPDPKLSRLSRKVREALIPELPPVTAGALLGPAALARHFIASASAGRYRDLFWLWQLFRQHPEEVRPVLGERQIALDKARRKLGVSVRFGLLGNADRVAEDLGRAEGLIWQWLREEITSNLRLVGGRPAITAALLEREPGLSIPLPDRPDDRWLSEAAALRATGGVPEPIDRLLAANVDRLPGTVATLSLASQHYPERVEVLLDRVDLASPNIGSVIAWARDHGHADHLRQRIAADVGTAAQGDLQEGLARWFAWRERGVEVPLPDQARHADVSALDRTRPESAELIAVLVAEGAPIDPQAEVEALAGENRQRAEKAYEAFVCAGLPVRLPSALHENPVVKEGTRCPACDAWTWVRPGHERRCPRLAGTAPAPPEPEPAHTAADDWTAAAAATSEPLTEPATEAPAERSDRPAGAPALTQPGSAPAPGATQDATPPDPRVAELGDADDADDAGDAGER